MISSENFRALPWSFRYSSISLKVLLACLFTLDTIYLEVPSYSVHLFFSSAIVLILP